MIKSLLSLALPVALMLFSCNANHNTETTEVETDTILNTEPSQDQDNNQTNMDTLPSDTSTTPPDNVMVNEQNPAPTKQQQLKKEVDRITVSFISIGEGIDGKALDDFKAFLEKWTASGKKPEYEIVGWGREGETDICINTSNLNDEEAKKLLAETRKKVEGNSLVLVETNQSCREQRIRK